MILYHGSTKIIEKPTLAAGKKYNDYGQGFYCTKEIEVAKEWACRENSNGFVNKYRLKKSGLKVLDLQDERYSVLNWIAVLLSNRTFSLENEIAAAAKEYIVNNFSVDTAPFDVIVGYRADDSYFSFARDFINNTLPLASLEKAMHLGKLGIQYVLVSEKAFSQLTFAGAEAVRCEVYYQKYTARDAKAREAYKNELRHAVVAKSIFVMDIIREGMKNGDPRIR